MVTTSQLYTCRAGSNLEKKKKLKKKSKSKKKKKLLPVLGSHVRGFWLLTESNARIAAVTPIFARALVGIGIALVDRTVVLSVMLAQNPGH